MLKPNAKNQSRKASTYRVLQRAGKPKDRPMSLVPVIMGWIFQSHEVVRPFETEVLQETP